MRLTKVQRYLEKLKTGYSYRYSVSKKDMVVTDSEDKVQIIYNEDSEDAEWGDITIIDKKENYTHIWEGEGKIIFFWRQKDTDNIINEFFKTQDEVIDFFTVKNGVVVIKK